MQHNLDVEKEIEDKDKSIALTCVHFVRCNVTKNCTNEQCSKCRFYEGYNFGKENN